MLRSTCEGPRGGSLSIARWLFAVTNPGLSFTVFSALSICSSDSMADTDVLLLTRLLPTEGGRHGQMRTVRQQL